VPEATPYSSPKRLVWEAYQRGQANRGAAGGEGEAWATCEKELKRKLSKIWNRMASGAYVPPPVRLVEREQANGGTRPLGRPTGADRGAQTGGKRGCEPRVAPAFHPDADGYRPGRRALDAVGVARKRGWEADGVLERDMRACCERLDGERVERAVAHHTAIPWVRLSMARWL
jgi:retron-type reverse transcriptase